MAKKVQIANLSGEIEKMLSAYADDVADETDAAAKKAAQQCQKDIRANAESAFRTYTAKPYAKQWAVKQTEKARGKASYTVYCKTPGLPHLLENGHAKVTGGRVAGVPHIAPAAEKAVGEFERSVEELVQRAGK